MFVGLREIARRQTGKRRILHDLGGGYVNCYLEVLKVHANIK